MSLQLSQMITPLPMDGFTSQNRQGLVSITFSLPRYYMYFVSQFILDKFTTEVTFLFDFSSFKEFHFDILSDVMVDSTAIGASTVVMSSCCFHESLYDAIENPFCPCHFYSPHP